MFGVDYFDQISLISNSRNSDVYQWILLNVNLVHVQFRASKCGIGTALHTANIQDVGSNLTHTYTRICGLCFLRAPPFSH